MRNSGFLWLLLCQVTLGLDIFVDKNRGIENSTCVTGGESLPCANLGLALVGLKSYNHSKVWISEGVYILNGDFRYAWMVNVTIAAHLDNQTLLSPDALPVTVQCQNDTGLSFVYTTSITIRGLEFVGCGEEQYSTSRKSNELQFYQFYAALYFLYASSVTLEYVGVTQTPGTGVVMYATVGNNAITNCAFSFNSPAPNASGGGGLYIEFPYCAPTATLSQDVAIQNCSLQSNVPPRYVEDSVYDIDSCDFHNNSAKIQNESDFTFILPHWETHLAFGRGAGISVFFKGFSQNNHISVKNCSLENNTALWGAGLFVEHQDMSYNNTVIMESTIIAKNRCFHQASESKGTGGGGARLGHIFYGDANVSYTRMIFRNVTFSWNKAYYGGGVSFYTARDPTRSNATNAVEFYNCTWQSNVARVGSAVDLSVWHPIPYGAIASPIFSDCKFFFNTAQYTSQMGQYVGIGAFYSDFIPVDFYGVITFKWNTQTALACIGARLSFHSSCTAEFVQNSGRDGGAMALMGYSFIQVSRNTTLRFVRNTAELKGGAIFGQSIGEHDLISSRNCFFRYDDIEITPWAWEATFYFENNTANSDLNSIYATSLLTCLWGGAYGSASTLEEIQDVFCWNRDSTPTQWIYSSGSCMDEIATSPAKFMMKSNSSDCFEDDECDISIAVIPGVSAALPFYTMDDRDNDITSATVFTAKLLNDDCIVAKVDASLDSTSLYISDNSVQLFGMPNDSVCIKLETIDPRVISVQVKVNFSNCPPGMILSDEGSKCICGGDYFALVHCHPSLFVSDLRRGAWIGMQENSSMYVAGECPYCSLFTDKNTLELPRDASNLTKMLCNSINRTGVLCGHCLPGYGPVANGYGVQCHLCPDSKTKYNWIFYLMTEFLPITIFFFIVVFLNVSATSGPANAFVFFAQVLTTTLKIDGDGAIPLNNITNATGVLTALYTIPYDIWNQNFFHPFLPKFCLSPNLTTLQLLSTGYITAFYPLLLVIMFSAVVWAYGRGMRPVLFLCRPIHMCFVKLRIIWNLQRSIVHALATFMILSYTKFALVSFTLLTSTPLYDHSGTAQSHVLYYDGTIPYMGRDHIPYVIVSLIVLATFVILPPIVLAMPSLILLTKKLYRTVLRRDLEFPSFCSPGPRLDQFLNAFHGCYKDGTGGSPDNNIDCRWFAAFYFFLRLVLFLVFAFTPYWFLQFVIQQLVCLLALLTVVIFHPYKKPLFNFVDACVFANLAAITALSMYQYHLSVTGSKLHTWAFVVQYILIFLPLLYMVVYVVYFLWEKYGSKRFTRNETLLETEDASFLEYADKNERYRDISGSYQHRASLVAKRNLDQQDLVIHEEETGSRQSLSPSHTSNNYGAFVSSSGVAFNSRTVHSASQATTVTAEGKDLVDVTA